MFWATPHGFQDLSFPKKESKESEVAQSHLTLCNPMHCSPPGSSIHGVFQVKSAGVACHLASQTGIKPQAQDSESTESPNHWTTRGFPYQRFESLSFTSRGSLSIQCMSVLLHSCSLTLTPSCTCVSDLPPSPGASGMPGGKES